MKVDQLQKQMLSQVQKMVGDQIRSHFQRTSGIPQMDRKRLPKLAISKPGYSLW